MRNNLDWSPWDVEELPEQAVPRTSYQPAKRYEDYIAGYPTWDESPAMKALEQDGDRADLGRYLLPFQPVDRTQEMTRAHEVFTERLAGRAAPA